VLHGVRGEMRESERSLQSSKEWEDVVTVSTPCKLLIRINIAMLFGLNYLPSYAAMFFIFCDFQRYLWPDF
jgi:hypothetical protein